MTWLMPIEATSPQPNAKANSMIDRVRMNLSRTSGPKRRWQLALLCCIRQDARSQSSPFHRFI
jgi:hypothetical protein